MIRLLLPVLALAFSPRVMPGTAGVLLDEPPVTAQESELERQTRNVASQLRCVVCQGLSIQDSPSSLAQEMRAVVREQLAAGRTPEQVKAYFVQKYGEFVLLEPRPSGFNLVVYIAPVLLLIGGAAFVLLKAKQWTTRAPVVETSITD